MIAYAGLVALFLGVVCLGRTVRMWREPRAVRLVPPPLWPASAIYWRAVHRALAALTIAAVAAGGACVLTLVDPLLPLRLALAYVSLGCLALAVLVMATNRPKVLVPPVLRELPGALEEERHERGERAW